MYSAMQRFRRFVKDQADRTSALCQAVPAALRLGGGAWPTTLLAARLYRSEGWPGLKRWLATSALQGANRRQRIRHGATGRRGMQNVPASVQPSTARCHPLINARDSARAANCRILVAISFHFVPGRIGYLQEVARTLAAFPVKTRHIAVYTNTTDAGERQVLQNALTDCGLGEGRDAEIIVKSDLPHPFELTWAHKELITSRFSVPNSDYTHFIYLEDDERLTFDNFTYFLVAREILRPHGLVPAFLRTEWNSTGGFHVNTDSDSAVALSDRPFVRSGSHAFFNMDKPYCGAFILDQELARDYIKTPSFDLQRSCTASPWDIRERAAMGMTFESPPSPFSYRVAVPASIASRAVPHCAWLAHLPNNYADNPDSAFGKIAMKSLILETFNVGIECQPLLVHERPATTLDLSIRDALRPFSQQHYVPSAIVVAGVDPGRAEGADHRVFPGTVPGTAAAGESAQLFRLTRDGNGEPLITETLPIAGAPGGGGAITLGNLAQAVGDRTVGPGSGDVVAILGDRMLERLLTPLEEDLAFRAVVIVMSGRGDRAGRSVARKLQRDLFDRGLIAVGSTRLAGREAQCFLASDAVRTINDPGTERRGFIAMSDLGTNGRFANQLFQYAFVKLYALRHGLTAVVPDWEGGEIFGRKDPVISQAPLAQLNFEAFKDDERRLWELDDPPINIDVSGYFQEVPDCWRRQRPLLRHLFQLPCDQETIIDEWRYDATRGGQRTLVGIHVRRGDYRSLSHDEMPWFRLVPEEHYIALLKDLWPTLRDPVLFVATDEPDAVLPHFKEFGPIAPNAGALRTVPAHVLDFEILRRSDVLAISNSSFSRMAAILAAPSQRCFLADLELERFVPYQPWGDRYFWKRFETASTAASRDD